MTQALIAITSCHAHREWQQSQRDTWIKDIPQGSIDYKFFLGNPNTGDAKEDEVFLDCPDGYHELIYKTVALMRWACEYRYDFVFKTDVDTLVNPVNFLNSGFESHGYTGGLNGHFASGGSGYCLCRESMEIVANSQPRDGSSEDVFVADLIWREHNIPLYADERYAFYPGTSLTKDTISFHISSTNGWPNDVPKYTPDQMYTKYAEAKAIW